MDVPVVRILWLSLITIMIDCSMDAFTPPSNMPGRNNERKAHLVPSQVIRSSEYLGSRQSSKKNKVGGDALLLIPSQVLRSSTQSTETQPQSDTAGILKRSRRRKRPGKKRAAATAKSNNTTFPLAGNLPDIYWRAVSMEHLRQHPRFRALKEPHEITELSNLEDARSFRQESWQWDVLHHGRCTTSQAVAALGFLEPSVGEVLGVPQAWRRGGMGAFWRLTKKALRSLDEMNKVLCVDEAVSVVSSSSGMPPVWTVPSDDNSSSAPKMSFAADYDYELMESEVKDRKTRARKFSQNEELSRSIRMMWGNTQEASALLTSLNYFAKIDPNFVLEETGMCGAGLNLNTTQQLSSLLIGATPDGVLRHSDGRIEALEVKNHCPFYVNSFHGKAKNSGGKMKRFGVGSRPFDDDKSNGVFSHYVPQLQMEMLCLGPDCRSAVMVRQTATIGALILRMHRDDEWIEEMLYWLHRFHIDFVEKDLPPPKNFFWDAVGKEDRARYRRFVNKTKEIRNSLVEIVARIPNDEVQRMGEDAPLFLD